MKPNAVFFDLDGTLLDTAQDFAYAINLLREKHQKPPVDFDLFRHEVYGESKRMISFAFEMQEEHPQFESLRQDFLKIYHQNCTKKTVFFDGIENILSHLDLHKIPWGIITNKPAWLTTPIVNHFGLAQRACCVISGDTLPKAKPDPLPLLTAFDKANAHPKDVFYIGDSKTDVLSAKNAGCKSIAVKYGYHAKHDDIHTWGADYLVETASEILLHLR